MNWKFVCAIAWGLAYGSTKFDRGRSRRAYEGTRTSVVGGGGGVAVSVGVATDANAFGTNTGALTLTSWGDVVWGGGGSGAEWLERN
jgi:hypothetical protein